MENNKKYLPRKLLESGTLQILLYIILALFIFILYMIL
jgi:hypothetical protein